MQRRTTKPGDAEEAEDVDDTRANEDSEEFSPHYRILSMVSRFTPGQIVSIEELSTICPNGKPDLQRLLDHRTMEPIDVSELPEHIADYTPLATGVNLPNAPVPQVTDKQHTTYIAHAPDDPDMQVESLSLDDQTIRGYEDQISSLLKDNDALQKENEGLKRTVDSLSAQNVELSKRAERADLLNVPPSDIQAQGKK